MVRSTIYQYPTLIVSFNCRYVVLGNHDYYGHSASNGTVKHRPLAQIEYTLKKKDNRWNMPADYYTKSWTVPNSKKTLQIFFIDTVGIAPNHKSPALTGLPPANPDGSTSDLQKMYRQPQVDWLKAELAASTADYKIIAGHYHGISLSYCNISLCYITFSYIVYTVTDGDDVIPDMENILVPLMQKHGVIAYIHGHEHNAEVATPLLLLKDASLVRL